MGVCTALHGRAHFHSATTHPQPVGPSCVRCRARGLRVLVAQDTPLAHIELDVALSLSHPPPVSGNDRGALAPRTPSPCG